MVELYDLVVDCTDAPSTRYLISDAAVVCSKPLVSGSALGTEGQLAVYGYQGGPCYRCVFPTPPPAESVFTCGEGGILGPGILISIVFLTVSRGGDRGNAGTRGDKDPRGIKFPGRTCEANPILSQYDNIFSI